MTGKTMKQLRRVLYESGGQTALVRGSAPPRPPNTVTVAPGVAASLGATRRRAPLYVTAEVPSGRTVRRYDGADVRRAADCVAELAHERDPTTVWLCDRDQIASWWAEEVADRLERRLTEVAREADAPLVVWTNESGGAVADRYDVVLDP
ncbi:hypothetical protein [Halorussus amylolyticus]|uniref:hypothetical protein n=1 Tax=Halorussus amylolyticus TaxID=1126242 RepID=UPI00104F603E|nr:hypothetical protein [Halorussus amylolyticus]